MIARLLEAEIRKRLFSGKAVVITGPRQAGKTTLIENLIKFANQETLTFNGDDPTSSRILNRSNTEQIRNMIGRNKIIFIDEAQKIPEIGITAKIIVDQFKEVQLILSGSSSFDLMELTQEPLTGRKWSFNLWPLSWQEWQEYTGYVKAEQDLENRLVYGFYPDVLTHPEDQQIILKDLVSSYLYKDVLSYARIKKPQVLQNLVHALALQVGSEVSFPEIASFIGIDQKTVRNYVDVLEKAFILFSLHAYSTNQRDEIKTNRKIYFYDNGVRNVVAGLLQPFQMRSDIGALWENFLISERTKYLSYHGIMANQYFWRTKQQQEIDYVEIINGQVFGFEFKWNEKRKARFPKTFTTNYQSINSVINRENFREFLLSDKSIHT